MCAYFAGNKELNLLNPESFKIFRDLVENIKMGIFMADSHGNLFYVNHEFNQICAFKSCDHATGINWMQLFFPDSKSRSEFLDKFQSRGGVVNFETIHFNLVGQKIPISMNINQIHNDRGEVIGIRGAILDISELKKLEEQLRIEHVKLEEILNFYNHLSEIKGLNELETYIVNQTAQILESKRCSLMIFDSSNSELFVKSSCGIPEEFLQNNRVKIGQPVAGIVALKSQSILVENIEEDELFKRQKRKSYTNVSFMSAPLIYESKFLGIINVTEKSGKYTATNLKILETIAKYSSINIAKTQSMNQFEYLSQTDPMTGLLNFRYFSRKLDEETSRASRYTLGLSLMMIDVDSFKKYNDTYGHPKGDSLLQRLADIFRNNLRSSEYICRYGGDEFIIIMPNTGLAQAVIVGEKLCDKVIKEFATDHISLSIGVAQFQHEDNKEVFIKQTDQALYQAKMSGRNQVCQFKRVS